MLYFRQKRLCHWCKKVMHHPDTAPKGGGASHRKLATLDHLDDRFSVNRGAYTGTGQERTVLACYDCNHKRGAASEKQQGIEEVRRRSRREPETILAAVDAVMEAP